MGWRQIGAAVLGLALGIAGLLVLLSPRVTGNGLDSETISASQSFVITLNQPVSLESARNHLSISPNVVGELSISGSDLIFRPAQALASGETYVVSIGAGLRGENGLPLLLGSEISFTVNEPRLLYLIDKEGVSDLWMQDADGSSYRLTDEPLGIWDYSITPDGREVLISSLNANGGMDLISVSADGQKQTILACPDSLCRSPHKQPAGSLIAYERQSLDAALDESEVWLLDTADDRSAPVKEWSTFELSDLSEIILDAPTSFSPRWSADGRYLAYYNPDARVIVVQDIKGGQSKIIPANMELMGGWSPDGYRLAYTELAFGQEEPHEHTDEAGSVISHTRPSLYQHVIISDLALDETIDLDQDLEVNNGRPAWHPNDQTLVVGRTTTGSGRQIWRLPTRGGNPSPLTDDPFFNHTSFSWSPDGGKLAFMRTGLADDGGVPGVWILDPESGKMELKVESAYLPGWLP